MSHVAVTRDGAVTTIRLDRASKKNALDGAMYRGLAEAMGAARRDDGVRAVILTGGPEVFCAGNDLADFARVRSEGAGLSAGDFLGALVDFDKPLVAAVAGWAVGIGTTMLLHCDLVIAAPGARFKTPFVDLALVPEAGSSVLLPAAIGARRATEMVMLGGEVDAATAAAWGLVNEVAEDPIARANELAAALASKPPNALRATRRLLRRTSLEQVKSAMAAEQEAFLAQLKSDEARDAVMAMLARRR